MPISSFHFAKYSVAISAGKLAFGLGLWFRRGDDKELGTNELLMSKQLQIQYIYDGTVAPSWAPVRSYIIAGDKTLLDKEARGMSDRERCHMDELESNIEAAVRGNNVPIT